MGKYFMRAVLQIQRFQYHHGGKYGNMSADIVLEKELTDPDVADLHLDLQAAG